MLEGVIQLLVCDKALEPGNCMVLEPVSDLVTSMPMSVLSSTSRHRSRCVGITKAIPGLAGHSAAPCPFGTFRAIKPSNSAGLLTPELIVKHHLAKSRPRIEPGRSALHCRRQVSKALLKRLDRTTFHRSRRWCTC